MNRRGSFLLWSAAVLYGVPFVVLAAGDVAADAELRSLAATCAACHGTDGHAVSGPLMLRLAGLPRADFVRQMRAFRDGTRAATVMQQIAKGYTEEQTEKLGDFFAAQR